MSRSKNSRRGTKASKYGKDLWGKRAGSGWAHSSDNKKTARRLDRAQSKSKLNKEVRDDG